MARFEGAAAHSAQHLRSVARVLESSVPLLTPTERKEAASTLNFAVDASVALTKFLGDAPAEDILRCGCVGCEHIKAHLAALRKVAHR